jgi:uncharacterized cofD-like protein
MPEQSPSADVRNVKHPLRIVLFSGGTACRSINIALCKHPAELTRIVPAWDSGGSSKVLRETFGMLPVGDIRQALMTMAHGEGRAGDVVKICNSRLSDHLGAAEIRAELEHYTSGAHPLLLRMEPDLRSIILNYINLFKARVPSDFDLRNGSIGNFILTGAYFAHGQSIDAAILAFRELCSIAGNVWPASRQNDVQLGALLRNGRELAQQHQVTRLEGDDTEAGIEHIRLYRQGAESAVEADRAALEAVERADLIVFGPGSFFTSILPHLHVAGIGRALGKNATAPRIFIGNILDCAETRNATLGDLIETFEGTARERLGLDEPLLTHVLSNRELFPFEKTVGKFRYLPLGRLEDYCADNGIAHISGDFEDAWTRGQHDGEAIVGALLDIATAG